MSVELALEEVVVKVLGEMGNVTKLSMGKVCSIPGALGTEFSLNMSMDTLFVDDFEKIFRTRLSDLMAKESVSLNVKEYTHRGVSLMPISETKQEGVPAFLVSVIVGLPLNRAVESA